MNTFENDYEKLLKSFPNKKFNKLSTAEKAALYLVSKKKEQDTSLSKGSLVERAAQGLVQENKPCRIKVKTRRKPF